ncbi:MAG: hypothetical protein NZZ41_06735 [Candidatus Dojkabacteria bacterium]|nr:hypothetical protein [Candidatus Dojkabacteria bacterium]
MFDKVKDVLDRLYSLTLDDFTLYESQKAFLSRILSERTAKGRKTKQYSPLYFNFRRKVFGYSNRNHNYYLTGLLLSTLKLMKQGKIVVMESQAQYLESLSKGQVGRKYYPIVREAFDISDLSSHIAEELRKHIKTNIKV